MANRSRDRGNNFERLIVNELKALGYPGVVTARSESRNMDNRGVDIFDMGIEEGVTFPYYVQNKCMTTPPNYEKLIMGELIPSNKPLLVFFRQSEKVKNRFYNRGDYVILSMGVFDNLFPYGDDSWTSVTLELKGNQVQPNIYKVFTSDQYKDVKNLHLNYWTKDGFCYIATRKEEFYSLIKPTNE